MRKILADRFWEKVDIRGPDDCWEWLGFRLPKGYGRMWANGKMRLATHVLFFLRHGYWPPVVGKQANHRCDNPPCLNPRHLYLGTQKSNARDRIYRGRQAKGEQHGMAKLTRKQVREIRKLSAQGIIQRELGYRFGVARTTISRIVAGKYWNAD